MTYSIRITDKWGYHASVVCGLNIAGPEKEFPLYVGCSLRTLKGEIVDIPARWLKSPGKAIWVIKADKRFKTGEFHDGDWEGYVMLALWRNETFKERLADTGWIHWCAPYLIGSSTAGLDMSDEFIKKEYAGRFDVWFD